MPLRKMIEYVPLGLHAYLWMGIGFVFWYFVGVLLGGGGFGTVVFAMIAGPFSGWVAGTIYWMLRLIPVEREIARQAEVKRQRRQEYLAELRVKNEATKKVREEREREDKKRRDREYREWYQTLSDEAKREEDRIEAARYRALQKAKVQRKYGVTLND